MSNVMALCRDCHHYEPATRNCIRAEGPPDYVNGEPRQYLAQIERMFAVTGACGPQGVHFRPRSAE